MFFSKAILFVVSLAAISVMATPHALNHIHHRAIAARAVSPTPKPSNNLTDTARAPHRKRQNAQKCRERTSTSSSLVPSSVSISPQLTHTPAQHQAAAVTTPESSPPPASQQAPTTPSPSPTPTPTPTRQPPAPTTSQPSPSTTTSTPTAPSSGGSNGFLNGINQGGDMTFYNVGLGACGETSADSDLIVAVSIILFNKYPGYNGGNPNDNPVCGKQIKITYGGNSVTVTVRDACEACAELSLDLSPTAFSQLASQEVGRLHGAVWEWV